MAVTEAPAPAGAAATGALPSRVVRALARREGTLLLHHPAVVVMSLLTPLFLLGARSGLWDMASVSQDLPVGLVPLGWTAIVVSHLAVTRGRRHGTEELFLAAPTTPLTRTAAHLLAPLALLPLALALLSGWLVVERVGFDVTGSAVPSELATGLVLVVGGGVAGVFAARWAPSVVAGPVAVIAVSVINGVASSSETSTHRWLGFWAQDSLPALLISRPARWHLVYLAGLTLLVAGGALARHGWSRPVAGLLGAAALLVGVGGWAQTRGPSTGQVLAIAARLEQPEQHQVCDVHAGVRYCAYDGHEDRIAEWREPVERVLAAVPPGVRQRGLEVRQRAPLLTGNTACSTTPLMELLASEVRGQVSPERVWRADGAVHPRFDWPDRRGCGNQADGGLVLATETAAWAVGLPAAMAADGVACDAGGQARALAALWLGGQVSPQATAFLRTMLDDSRKLGGGPFLTFDWSTPPDWAVAWRKADVAAALGLLELPRDSVASVLGAHWERITHGATPARYLMALAGAPVPSASVPIPGTLGTEACP